MDKLSLACPADNIVRDTIEINTRLAQRAVKDWARLTVLTGNHPRAESFLNSSISHYESWKEFFD